MPGRLPSFEVASVKENTSGDSRARIQTLPGGRFVATNVLLKGADCAVEQIEFRPSPDGPFPRPAPDCWRSLLQERFKLRAHRETRELPVYELRGRTSGRQARAATAPVDGRLRRARGRGSSRRSLAGAAAQRAAAVGGDAGPRPRPRRRSSDAAGGRHRPWRQSGTPEPGVGLPTPVRDFCRQRAAVRDRTPVRVAAPPDDQVEARRLRRQRLPVVESPESGATSNRRTAVHLGVRQLHVAERDDVVGRGQQERVRKSGDLAAATSHTERARARTCAVYRPYFGLQP